MLRFENRLINPLPHHLFTFLLTRDRRETYDCLTLGKNVCCPPSPCLIRPHLACSYRPFGIVFVYFIRGLCAEYHFWSAQCTIAHTVPCDIACYLRMQTLPTLVFHSTFFVYTHTNSQSYCKVHEMGPFLSITTFYRIK